MDLITLMLNIVTGNVRKFNAAMSYLSKYDIKAKHVNIELIEPQGENVRDIAIAKVEQAFLKLQEPVVVMDTGWSIPSLNGFPGAYMHSILEWFTLEDLLNLMKTKSDRTIIIQNYACYKDVKITKIFTRRMTGIIKHEPKGEGNIIDRIVSFRKDGKTNAECEALRIPMSDKDSDISQWEKLARWLYCGE